MAFSTRILLVLSVLMALCCSRKQTTVLIDSWSDSEIVSPGYNRLLVIGVSPNPESRRTFERQMLKDLQKRGVFALSWLDVVAEEEEVNVETFRKYFESEELDAVLVTRVIQSGELPLTVPSNRRKSPPSELYDNFYNYYEHVRVQAGDPKDFQSGTAVFLETNLYDVGDASLVWAGQSKSFVMHKPKAVIQDISKVVVEVFAAEGIVE